MADIMSRDQRSKLMARVRTRDTRPERELRRRLWSRGLRYRLMVPLPGSPDLVFKPPRVAVFVDGCFWHGCPEHGSIPKTNPEFWAIKLAQNRERDDQVNRALRDLGWTVLRFWEHEIFGDLERVAEAIEHAVRNPIQ